MIIKKPKEGVKYFWGYHVTVENGEAVFSYWPCTTVGEAIDIVKSATRYGGWFSEKQDHSSAKKRLNEVAQQILKECRS